MKRKPPPSQRPERQRGTTTMLHRSDPVTSPALEIPEAERARIARAVHRTVDSIEGPTTRGGACGFHALAGFAIIRYAHNLDVHVQCGSLGLTPDPSDPTLQFEINAHRPGSREDGEFHAWLMTTDGVVIDFSARDWPAMVERDKMPQLTVANIEDIPGPISAFNSGMVPVDEAMRYRRPRLDYLWSAWNMVPDYIRIKTSEELTPWAMSMLTDWDDCQAFIRRAIALYRNPDVVMVTPGGIV